MKFLAILFSAFLVTGAFAQTQTAPAVAAPAEVKKEEVVKADVKAEKKHKKHKKAKKMEEGKKE